MPISEQITEAGGTFIGTDELGDSIFYFGAQSLAIDMRRPGEQDIARGIGPDGKPAAPILVTVAPGPLIEAVSTGTGDDLVQGSDLDTNIENIFGGAGDDTLNGNGGDDALNGDTGRDRLFGGP